MESSPTRVTVAVRCRPLSDQELTYDSSIAWECEPRFNRLFELYPDGGQGPYYSYDKVFGPSSYNAHAYFEFAKPIVDSTLDGYNGTVFAYGQTSSGKTHTLMGYPEDPGVIILSVQDVFESLRRRGCDFLVRVSYIEIYNEEIRDLLAPPENTGRGRSRELKVVEHPTRGVFVHGVTEEMAVSPERVFELLAIGEQNRHVAATNMNVRSSRSHTVFRMVIETRQRKGTAPRHSQLSTATKPLEPSLRRAADAAMIAVGGGEPLSPGPPPNVSPVYDPPTAVYEDVGAFHQEGLGLDGDGQLPEGAQTARKTLGPTLDEVAQTPMGRWDGKELFSPEKRRFGQSSDSPDKFHHDVTDAAEEAEEPNPLTISALNLVDLAGSERLSRTDASGSRMKEGANINLSLLTLGAVISKLSQGSPGHIPYRNSKLTRLLSSSLGGNAKTAVLVTISPADINRGETRSSLRFADRAKKVINQARVNAVNTQDAVVAKYKREIAQLKAALLQGGGGLVVTPNGEVVSAEEIVRRVQAEKHESFYATKAEIKSNMQRSMVMQSENASILRLLLVASHAVGNLSYAPMVNQLLFDVVQGRKSAADATRQVVSSLPKLKTRLLRMLTEVSRLLSEESLDDQRYNKTSALASIGGSSQDLRNMASILRQALESDGRRELDIEGLHEELKNSEAEIEEEEKTLDRSFRLMEASESGKAFLVGRGKSGINKEDFIYSPAGFRTQVEQLLHEHEELLRERNGMEETLKMTQEELEAARDALWASKAEVRGMKVSQSTMEVETKGALALSSSQQKDLVAAQAELERLRSTVRSLTSRNALLRSEIEGATQSKASNSVAEALEEARDEISNLKKKLAKAEEGVTELAAAKEELQHENGLLTRERDEFLEKLEHLADDHNSIKAENRELRAKTEDLERELRHQRAQAKSFESENERLQLVTSTVKGELSSSRTENKGMSEAVATMKEALSKAQQEAEDARRESASWERDMLAARRAAQAIEATLKETQVELNDAKRKLNDAKSLNSKFEAQVEELRAKLRESSTSMSSMRSQSAQRTVEHQNLVQQLDDRNEEYRVLKERAKQTEARMEEDLREIRKELANQRSQNTELQTRCLALEGEISTLEAKHKTEDSNAKSLASQLEGERAKVEQLRIDLEEAMALGNKQAEALAATREELKLASASLERWQQEKQRLMQEREEQTDKVNALADALEAVTASRDEALVKAAKAVEDLKKRKNQEAMVLESFRDLERDLSLLRFDSGTQRLLRVVSGMFKRRKYAAFATWKAHLMATQVETRQRSHALARLRALFHGQEKQALMRALNTWKAAHRNLQRNTEHSERRRGLGLRFLTRWAQATAQRNKLSAFLHWWRCTLQLREQEARVAADNRTKLVTMRYAARQLEASAIRAIRRSLRGTLEVWKRFCRKSRDLETFHAYHEEIASLRTAKTRLVLQKLEAMALHSMRTSLGGSFALWKRQTLSQRQEIEALRDKENSNALMESAFARVRMALQQYYKRTVAGAFNTWRSRVAEAEYEDRLRLAKLQFYARRLEGNAQAWLRRSMQGAFSVWRRFAMQASAECQQQMLLRQANEALLKGTLQRLEASASTWLRKTTTGAFEQWRRFVHIRQQEEKMAELQQQQEQLEQQLKLDTLRRLEATAISWFRNTLGGSFEQWKRFAGEAKREAEMAAEKKELEANLMRSTLARLEATANVWIRQSTTGAFETWKRFTLMAEQHRIQEQLKRENEERIKKSALRRIEASACAWLRGTLTGAFEQWQRHVEEQKAAERELQERTLAQQALMRSTLQRLEGLACQWLRSTTFGGFEQWKRVVEHERKVEAENAIRKEAETRIMTATLRRLEATATAWLRSSRRGAFEQWRRVAVAQQLKEREEALERERQQGVMRASLRRLEAVAKVWLRSTTTGAFETWVRFVHETRSAEQEEAETKQLQEEKMRKALRRIEGSASAWLRGTTQGALLQWKRAIEILRMEGKARQAQQQAAQALQSSVLRRLESALKARLLSTTAGAFRTWVTFNKNQQLEEMKQEASRTLQEAKMRASLLRLQAASYAWLRNTKGGAFLQWKQFVAEDKKEEEERLALALKHQSMRENASEKVVSMLGEWLRRTTLGAFLRWRQVAAQAREEERQRALMASTLNRLEAFAQATLRRHTQGAFLLWQRWVMQDKQNQLTQQMLKEKQREGSQLLKSVISSWLRNTTQGALSRWKLFTLTAAHEANQQHMAADLRKTKSAAGLQLLRQIMASWKYQRLAHGLRTWKLVTLQDKLHQQASNQLQQLFLRNMASGSHVLRAIAQRHTREQLRGAFRRWVDGFYNSRQQEMAALRAKENLTARLNDGFTRLRVVFASLQHKQLHWGFFQWYRSIASVREAAAAESRRQQSLENGKSLLRTIVTNWVNKGKQRGFNQWKTFSLTSRAQDLHEIAVQTRKAHAVQALFLSIGGHWRREATKCFMHWHAFSLSESQHSRLKAEDKALGARKLRSILCHVTMRRQWRSFTQWVKATSEAKRRYAEQLVNSKQEEAVTQLHRQLQQEKLRYSAGLQENEKLLQNYRNQVEAITEELNSTRNNLQSLEAHRNHLAQLKQSAEEELSSTRASLSKLERQSLEAATTIKLLQRWVEKSPTDLDDDVTPPASPSRSAEAKPRSPGRRASLSVSPTRLRRFRAHSPGEDVDGSEPSESPERSVHRLQSPAGVLFSQTPASLDWPTSAVGSPIPPSSRALSPVPGYGESQGSIQATIDRVSMVWTSLLSQAERSQARIQSQSASLRRLQQTLLDVENKLTVEAERVAELESRLARRTDELQRLREDYAELKERYAREKDDNEATQQQLKAENNRLHDELQDQLERLKAESFASRDMSQHMQVEVERLVKEVEHYRGRAWEAEQARREAEEERRGILNTLSKIEKQVAQLQRELTQEKRRRAAAEAELQSSLYGVQAEKLSSLMSENSYSESRLREMKDTLGLRTYSLSSKSAGRGSTSPSPSPDQTP